MPRKTNVTSPISVEVIFVPDAEKVAEAIRIAAPAYRRALLKKIKEQQQAEAKPST
jgi:hypothetical protein